MIDRDTYLTDEEIVVTAKRCGNTLFDDLAIHYQTDEVLKFARAIEKAVTQKAAEGEREACATECEKLANMASTKGSGAYWMRIDCAQAIRARGIGGGK